MAESKRPASDNDSTGEYNDGPTAKKSKTDEKQKLQTRKGVVNPESARQAHIKRKEAEKCARKAEYEAERLREENTRLKTENDHLTEKQLAGTFQGFDYIQDDRKVQENIDTLFDMISDFAATYASERTLLEYAAPTQAAKVFHLLIGENPILFPQLLKKSVENEFTYNSMACRLTVEAFLTYKIAEDVLMQPFRFLSKNSKSDLAGLQEQFNQLHDRMNDRNMHKAIWTASTLRAIYASYQYSGPINESIDHDQFKEPRKIMNRTLVETWLEDSSPFATCLMDLNSDDEKSDRFDMLCNILHAADKLTLQLWVQDATVETFYKMGNSEDICHRYNKALMQHHALEQTMHIKNYEATDDVDFVIRPGIKLNRRGTNVGRRMTIIAAKAHIIVFPGNGRWREVRKNLAQEKANKFNQEKSRKQLTRVGAKATNSHAKNAHRTRSKQLSNMPHVSEADHKDAKDASMIDRIATEPEGKSIDMSFLASTYVDRSTQTISGQSPSISASKLNASANKESHGASNNEELSIVFISDNETDSRSEINRAATKNCSQKTPERGQDPAGDEESKALGGADVSVADT